MVEQLTGDVSHSAQRVSLELEISVLASEAKPQDKLNMIKRLQDDGSIVTMVSVHHGDLSVDFSFLIFYQGWRWVKRRSKFIRR